MTALLPKLGTGANSAFATQIAARYKDGAGWLFALDVATFSPEWAENKTISVVGIEKLNTIFFEQKQVNGADEVKASLGFQSARSGVASWLAEPGAAGSSEYVTPDAFMALSASTKNPRQAFDELVEVVSKVDPMDRAIGERAIATRASGYPLVRSASFRAQMPGISGMHHSGFLWLNTKGLLSDLAGLSSNAALKQLLEYRDPVLVVFDGSTERIDAASRTRLTSLVFDVLLASSAGKAEQTSVRAN